MKGRLMLKQRPKKGICKPLIIIIEGSNMVKVQESKLSDSLLMYLGEEVFCTFVESEKTVGSMICHVGKEELYIENMEMYLPRQGLGKRIIDNLKKGFSIKGKANEESVLFWMKMGARFSTSIPEDENKPFPLFPFWIPCHKLILSESKG